MRSRTNYCVLTGPAPRIFKGRYHKGHMQCIKAAKREEAEIRYEPFAAAKAAAAKAVAAAAAKAAPVQATAEPAKKPGNRKRKRRGPERLKASQR
jgi:hypothetical protein